MKLEIDTKNWFKDKYFTTLIIVGILAIANIVLSSIILARQCGIHNIWMHEMGMQNQWVVHTMMIRK